MWMVGAPCSLGGWTGRSVKVHSNPKHSVSLVSPCRGEAQPLPTMSGLWDLLPGRSIPPRLWWSSSRGGFAAGWGRIKFSCMLKCTEWGEAAAGSCTTELLSLATAVCFLSGWRVYSFVLAGAKGCFPSYTVIWVKFVVLPNLAGIWCDCGIFLHRLQYQRSSFAVKCVCCCSWGKIEFGLYKRYCRAAINLLAVGIIGIPKGINLLLEIDKCI